jgi:NADH:ubiquinone oxidoreductase subunit E
MPELEMPHVADARDYECWGCGREATDHVRARFTTPLGQTTIRVCGDKACAAAGAERLRGQFTQKGDVVRVLEVTRP